jgi:hypothetical protein
MANEWITTAQAAKRLKRSQRWVQSLILRERLDAELIGGIYLIRLSAIVGYKPQPRGRPANTGERKHTKTEAATTNGSGRKVGAKAKRWRTG